MVLFFQNTIFQRYGLVCDLGHIPGVVQSVYFAGSLIGAAASGTLTDRWGRKFVYLFGLHLVTLSAFVNYFAAPNVWVWTVSRFVAGLGTMALNLASNVYRTEIVAGKWPAKVAAWVSAVPAQLGIRKSREASF